MTREIFKQRFVKTSKCNVKYIILKATLSFESLVILIISLQLNWEHVATKRLTDLAKILFIYKTCITTLGILIRAI